MEKVIFPTVIYALMKGFYHKTGNAIMAMNHQHT